MTHRYLERLLHIFILMVVAIFTLMNASANAQESNVEILSKEDAAAVFGMSEEAWLLNVRKAVALNLATTVGSPETDLGMVMVMVTPEGDLLGITPLYLAYPVNAHDRYM